MFPTAHSQIYRNEAGEVTGWDNPSYDEPEYDPDDFLPGEDEDVCEWCGEEGTDANPLDFHVVSPPVSGYNLREEYVHAACASASAESQVR